MHWKVIAHVLKRYNFNLVLVDWINIMYTDISMCVYNNGKTQTRRILITLYLYSLWL